MKMIRISRCLFPFALAGGGLLASAAAADAETPRGPATAVVLDLPADGFLVGDLAPAPGRADAPRTTLLWRSPLFADPIEFEVDGIERIRFPRVDVPAAPATAWSVRLRNGGVATGTVEAVDAEHVVLAVPGVAAAPLRIRRAAIERMTRDAAVGKTIVPGKIQDWEMTSGAWQDLSGRLVGTKVGSGAFREVAGDPRLCFDLLLSWDQRPEFKAFFGGQRIAASAAAKAADRDSYRIEMTAGELRAIREGGAAAEIDRIGSTPAGRGSLHVQVFVDQSAGRMAVVLPAGESAGKPVFDKTLAAGKRGDKTGFGIVLRGGSVRIDELRVLPWTESEPRAITSGGLGGPEAMLESFDKNGGTFTFRGADGPKQMAMDEVAIIDFPAAETGRGEHPPGTVMAIFQGGTRILGRILEVGGDVVRLDCSALAEPLACGFGKLAEIQPVSRQATRPVPGLNGRLDAESGRTRGCLANAPAPGAGIAWQPQGAVRPVALSAETHGRISYDTKAAPPEPTRPDPAGEAVVYLKTGDSISCRVVAADDTGVRIRSGSDVETLVPHVAVRAIELAPGAGMRVAREKLERLLTLPRMQQADPPTHMLRLPNGDYLRGKLVSLDDKLIRFNVLGTVKSLPRTEIARLIWLSVEGDTTEDKAVAAVMGEPGNGGVPVRVTMSDGRYLSFVASRLVGDRLEGESGVLGIVAADLARCKQLDLGRAATTGPGQPLPFAQWKLRPAPQPRALRNTERPAAAPSAEANPRSGG